MATSSCTPDQCCTAYLLHRSRHDSPRPASTELEISISNARLDGCRCARIANRNRTWLKRTQAGDILYSTDGRLTMRLLYTREPYCTQIIERRRLHSFGTGSPRISRSEDGEALQIVTHNKRRIYDNSRSTPSELEHLRTPEPE